MQNLADVPSLQNVSFQYISYLQLYEVFLSLYYSRLSVGFVTVRSGLMINLIALIL
jgi:hypothetical protein